MIRQAFSWYTLEDGGIAKKCDNSFFKYNQSGIPKEYVAFFNELENEESFWITLVFNGVEYPAEIYFEPSSSHRCKIMWSKELGDIFNNLAITNIAKFYKESVSRFIVEIV